MKKTTAFLVALLILVTAMQPIILSVGATGSEQAEPTASAPLITSEGVLVDLNASSVTDGQATFKVTLPAGGYAQFTQSIPGLIINSNDNTTDYVQIKVGDNTSADLGAARFNIQLTDDATAATDIVPVAEKADGSGENPGTDAMTWFVLGSGGNLHYGKGSNTVGGPMIAAATHTNLLDNGVRLSFSNNGDKVKGYIKAFAKELTSTKTKEEVGLDKELYIRLRNAASEAVTYTFNIFCTEIEAASFDEDIITSSGAMVDLNASTVEDGKAVYKVALPQYGYAQFSQKLTDLIGGSGYVNVVAGNNTLAEYQGTQYWVQLTDDATAATDIAPVQEKTASGEVDPGTDAMSWLIYGNGNYIVGGRGASTAYYGTNFFTSSTCVTNSGMKMSFTGETDGRVGITTPMVTAKYPSYHTAEDVGIDEGAYVRIRNRLSEMTVYTITVVSEDIKADKEPDPLLTSQLITSTGADVDWDASSVVDGQATFKVTLPAGGYAQFTQKLTTLIGSNSGAAHVNVKIGNNTLADYTADTTWFNIQLTDDAAAAIDIVPVIEGGPASTVPSVDAMTWMFQIYSGNLYFNRGSNTAGATAAISPNEQFMTTGLRMRFDMDGDYVKGTLVGAADRARTSQRTLAEIGGTEGVYVRLRNSTAQAVTYTFTITSDDIKAPSTGGDEGGNEGGGEEPNPPTPPTPPTLVGEAKENSYDGKYKDYLYVTENGVVDESVTRVTTGTATLKVTLPAGGYFQYLQKLTDLLPSGQKGSSSVKITLDDYNTTDVQVQLTADAEAKRDFIPVDEKNGEAGGTDPGTYAMTWRVIREGTTNELFLRSGASSGSYQKNFGVLSNAPSHALPFFFSVNSDNKVTVSHTYNTVAGYANQSMPSYKTVEEVGLDEGAYVRIRNSGTETVTFTVTINSTSIYPIVSTAYKDGKWIFSDEDTVKISAESKEEKGIYYETLKATLSAGGYVQLDEKLAYLLDNDNAKINIMIGDNTKAEWDAARVQIQLTADGEAKKDILPVNENETDPGVLGMTWIFWGSGNQLWTGRGSTTAYGGLYGATNNLATVQSGLHVRFNRDGDKVAYNTTIGGLNISNNLPSTKTLADIGGEEGLYVRLRNAADTSVTYTITVQYTKAIIEQEPVIMKGWTVRGETADGVSITDETYDVNPGFRAWNLALPHNTYAQYNTKITDLKDASFVWDIGEYKTDNYYSTFAFVLEPDAPWDVKEPGKDLRQFKLAILSVDEAIRILLPTGKVVEGQSNANPTIGVLPPVTTIEGQGGYTFGIVEKDGHYYLAICGVLLDGAQVGEALEPYVRMDEYVEKGAYFRVYSRNGGYTNQTVSISSKVVPEIGSDEDDERSDEDKALDEFIDFFTDNIDALRKNDIDIFKKLYEMWNNLSYLNQGNIEAYFIDDSEPFDLIQLIKMFNPIDEGIDENTTPEDEYVLITEYITVYTTTTVTTEGETSENYEDDSEEVLVPEEQKKPSKNKGTKTENGGLELWVIIVIIAAAVVLIGAGTVAVLVIRKKKNNK